MRLNDVLYNTSPGGKSVFHVSFNLIFPPGKDREAVVAKGWERTR